MQLFINDTTYQVEPPEDEALLWVLRDDLGLTGTKYGCGAGICGSCTVLLDGDPVRSCVTPASAAEGKHVTTIEGLAVRDEDGNEVLHPVQQAFLDQQTPQCSWCMSGQMITAAAFLTRNDSPTNQEIRAAMGANYCRCGCYVRIQSAVALAAERMNGGSA